MTHLNKGDRVRTRPKNRWEAAREGVVLDFWQHATTKRFKYLVQLDDGGREYSTVRQLEAVT